MPLEPSDPDFDVGGNQIHESGRVADLRRDPCFVTGKPLTDIWAASGLRWREALAATIRSPLHNPHMHFIRNDRGHFDIDNLAYPVLEVAGSTVCKSVWASVGPGPVEGVWIAEHAPPPPPKGAISVRIEKPNTSSTATRTPPPELFGKNVVAEGSHLGLTLEFDSESVFVGALSYVGPTKSLIDDLGPLLGTRSYRGRMVSDDERVKELRISRGHRPGGRGVRVSIWPLD